MSRKFTIEEVLLNSLVVEKKETILGIRNIIRKFKDIENTCGKLYDDFNFSKDSSDKDKHCASLFINSVDIKEGNSTNYLTRSSLKYNINFIRGKIDESYGDKYIDELLK